MVPISKTAFTNYENPITLRSNEKSDKELKIELFDDTQDTFKSI
jgi:hypothetical protein